MPAVELREPGVTRVVLQMGMAKEEIEKTYGGVLHPQVLGRVIRLWADSDASRDFLDLGRGILIYECE